MLAADTEVMEVQRAFERSIADERDPVLLQPTRITNTTHSSTGSLPMTPAMGRCRGRANVDSDSN